MYSSKSNIKNKSKNIYTISINIFYSIKKIKVNSSDIKKAKIFEFFNESIYSILFYLKSETDTS